MNEFEAHENSYDHQHKKRLKEMKEMQRQVKDGGGGKKEGEKGPLMTIKLGGVKGKKEAEGDGKGGGGFKKGGFKNAFGPVGGEGEEERKRREDVKGEEIEVNVMNEEVGAVDSDVTDDEDYYDPRRPTGCMPGCPGHVGG